MPPTKKASNQSERPVARFGAAARVVQWAQEHGEVGGVMTSHRQMSEVLRAAGHEVRYVDTGSPVRAIRALPSLWRRRSLHVLHITRLWRAVPLVPVLALLPGATVLVLHSGSTARQISAMTPLRRWTVLRMLRTFDEIWVVNAAIRALLPPGLAERTTVVTPFDARGVAPHAEQVRDPHEIVLATNAGLPHYNADMGIQAVRLVRAEWPDTRLRILAYGHQGPEFAALRSAVARLDWVDLSFDLTEAQVSAVLSAAGVFLRPTSWDGDSVIVREALACGARVIASDVAPRPRGVELCGLGPVELAAAVLHGGIVSEGTGLVDTTLADAASQALVEHGMTR